MDLRLPKVEDVDGDVEGCGIEPQRLNSTANRNFFLGQQAMMGTDFQESRENKRQKKAGKNRRAKARKKANKALNGNNAFQHATNTPPADLIARVQQFWSQASAGPSINGRRQRTQAQYHLPQFNAGNNARLFGHQIGNQPQVIGPFLHTQPQPTCLNQTNCPETPYTSQQEAYAMGFRAGVRTALRDMGSLDVVLQPEIKLPIARAEYETPMGESTDNTAFVHPSRRGMVEFSA